MNLIDEESMIVQLKSDWEQWQDRLFEQMCGHLNDADVPETEHYIFVKNALGVAISEEYDAWLSPEPIEENTR